MSEVRSKRPWSVVEPPNKIASVRGVAVVDAWQRVVADVGELSDARLIVEAVNAMTGER